MRHPRRLLTASVAAVLMMGCSSPGVCTPVVSGNTSQAAPPKAATSTVTGDAPAPAPTPTPFSWSTLVQDMGSPGEGYIHGVPTDWDMQQGGSIAMGNDPGSWTAATAWGVVNQAMTGDTATNTRVNVRNIAFWLLRKSSQTWVLLQNTSNPDGAAYTEDFVGDDCLPGNRRAEPDGTFSVKVGGGYNYHYYPQRASIPNTDVGGILVVAQARLILDNPTGPDDRANAAVLMNVGGDYWPDLNSMVPGGGPNPGIAGSKFKYVKPYWRYYAMTTLSATQLSANPPPIDLSGISP